MFAAANGDVVAMKNLLVKGADANAINKYGETALMKAAFEGHTAAVHELIAADPSNINDKSNVGIPLSARFPSPCHEPPEEGKCPSHRVAFGGAGNNAASMSHVTCLPLH